VGKREEQLCLWAALFIAFVREDVAKVDPEFAHYGFELVEGQVVLSLFYAK